MLVMVLYLGTVAFPEQLPLDPEESACASKGLAILIVSLPGQSPGRAIVLPPALALAAA